MDPVALTERLGGVARYRTLIALGASRHRLQRAVAEERLQRLGSGVFAVPRADAALRAAAELGVVLSCVTLAARRGLWTLPVERAHVALAPKGHLRRATNAHVHWATPLLPRDPDAFEDSLVNALVLVAACQPYEHALAVWESALNKGLLDRDVLRGLPLGPDARRLLTDARPWADSGLESFFVPRLRWLRLPLRPQVFIAGHRVDLLIGDRLVVQVDGGHHVDLQRLQDNEHDARLRLMGYHVIRVGYWQVIDDWPTVQELIVTAVAQGLHRVRE
ncbi:type IV toxin-antitoxin system AbiEi family antitoxin domain-containing protein [Microbacterium album]|uniref:DNA/RNA helicase n=1 Tax=Microbacterium album TaxID=2053191 RepID=A0A917MML7_9MICO|nr:type IV toxin-antitoxin system AbiEi family antitoxin domain-containing protein [Microbacterium album]GGH45160.1 hypothetical protein GCM10010921_20350 [Microbacterium album]